MTTMEVSSRIFLCYVLFLSCIIFTSSRASSFDAVYQFGDSISDTGNRVRENPGGCGNAPYGETFFRHPTGRCSNGLLMVDYIAQELKLPFLNPYLEKGADFRNGVNFAVAGATALSRTAGQTNASLLVQLEWFKSHLSTICSNPSECMEKVGKSLILLGEIGGNDYNGGAFQGKSIDELRGLVPDVVQVIIDVATEVIKMGGKRIVIPGNFPSGCMTVYLAAFKTSDPNSYDELKCLKNWNELASYHNDHLQQAVNDLQQKHPDVTLIYADYFSTFRSILSNPAQFGFNPSELLKACCGAGDGDYNFDGSRMCGSPGATVCPQPDQRVSWDGIHPTQHTYQVIAQSLFSKILPTLI